MMRVLFSVFTAIVFLLVCVVFSRSSGALQGDTNFYLGQAATRSYFPTSLDKTNFYANARSVHYARNDLTSCQLAFTDSHISNGGPLPGEVAAGADTSIKVGWEYPLGNLPAQQILFGGSAVGTIPDGGMLISDPFNPNTPNGSLFAVRVWKHNAVGLGEYGWGQNTALGDRYSYSAYALPDLSLNGTITNTGGDQFFTPTAVICKIRSPSICAYGDSRAIGTHDTTDGSGDIGDIARSVGPYFGYIVMAQSGYSAAYFNTYDHTMRLQLAAYCTHVINETGAVDQESSKLAATETALRTLWALFRGKRVYQNTFEPFTHSTDFWKTTTNQAMISPNWGTANAWITTTPPGIMGYFDIANAVESSANSGFWLTNGIANYCTKDGVHATQACNILMKTSGAIPISAFRYPFLLRRDLKPASSDNSPAFVSDAAG